MDRIGEFEQIIYLIREDFNNRCNRYHLAKPRKNDFFKNGFSMSFAVNSDMASCSGFSFMVDNDGCLTVFAENALDGCYKMDNLSTQVRLVNDGVWSAVTYAIATYELSNPKFEIRKIVNRLFRRIKYNIKKNKDIKRQWFND